MTTRCPSCNGIVTKTDSECYSCGEKIEGSSGVVASLLRLFAKTPPPKDSIVRDRVLATRR